MITVTGLRLYRWYRQGVTNVYDLQWLLMFYDNIEMRPVLLQASIQAVRLHFGDTDREGMSANFEFNR